MGSNSRDVTLSILGQDKSGPATNSSGKNFDALKKKVDSVGKSGTSMGSKLKSGLSALKGPALAIGAALGALAVQAGVNASNAQQSLGSTQAIFGKTADAMIKKSQEAATKYGLSADQYRDSANLIGSLFKNQGVASSKLAGQTDAMIKKGSDLAAVFGGTTADAVDALGSAFKGEFDPLEKYGISLNQNTINAEALRVAHVKSTAQFNKLSTAAQKAAKQQATQDLITKQSTTSTGQFTAQSSTSAEQLQITKAKYENLSATIGAKLLPIFDKLLDIGGKVLDWAAKNKPTVIALGAAVAVLAASVLVLNAAFLANPVVLIIAAFAALAVGLVYCYNHFKTFRTITDAVWGALKDAWKWLKGPFNDFWVKTIPDAFKVFTKYLDVYIVNPYLSMIGFVLDGAAKAFGWIPGLGGKLKSAAKDFDKFKDDVNKALGGIEDQKVAVKVTVSGNGKNLIAGGRVVGGVFAAGGSGALLGTSSSPNAGATQPAAEVTHTLNSTTNLVLDGKVIDRRVQRAVDRSDRRRRVGVAV